MFYVTIVKIRNLFYSTDEAKKNPKRPHLVSIHGKKYLSIIFAGGERLGETIYFKPLSLMHPLYIDLALRIKFEAVARYYIFRVALDIMMCGFRV